MVRAERALIRAQERAQVQDRASFERTTVQALRRSATAQTQLRVEMAPMLRRMSEDLTGVQEQLPALVRQQKPRGWIGITMTGASEMRLTSEGRVLRHTEYPVVESVEPGSPAEKEGVEAGDTIIAFNGRDVRAHDVALDRMLDVNATLRMTIRRGRRTRTVVMKVQRRPEQRSVYFLTDSADGGRAVFVMPRPATTAFGGTVRVGAYAPVPAMPPSPPAVASAAPRPALPPAAAMVPQPPSVVAYSFGYGAATFAGASVMTMDDDLRSTLDVDGGLLVVRVAPGTPAAEAGLRSGDVLRAVDGSQLSTPGMFQRALERASDREVKLLIVRKRKEQTMMMRW
jgi:C-terminal processing protease CtpA/Prc